MRCVGRLSLAAAREEDDFGFPPLCVCRHAPCVHPFFNEAACANRFLVGWGQANEVVRVESVSDDGARGANSAGGCWDCFRCCCCRHCRCRHCGGGGRCRCRGSAGCRRGLFCFCRIEGAREALDEDEEEDAGEGIPLWEADADGDGIREVPVDLQAK